MSKTINFHKMVASGNDFVVVDNRRKTIRNPLKFTKKVSALHTGIGADGVLLLEKSRRADFKMRIINSDGSEAEACGNGFRCIAKYAKNELKYPKKFKFESISGIVHAHIQGKSIAVQLPTPKDLVMEGKLSVGGKSFNYSSTNTGVPHVVIFVPNLEKVDVKKYGRLIREHRNFKPKGTNVNFVQVKSGKEILVRTYERGVEDETLACGTGSTASAILSVLKGFTKSPVRVRTRSGEILKISFIQNGKKLEQVMLEGEAHFVYEGKLIND